MALAHLLFLLFFTAHGKRTKWEETLGKIGRERETQADELWGRTPPLSVCRLDPEFMMTSPFYQP